MNSKISNLNDKDKFVLKHIANKNINLCDYLKFLSNEVILDLSQHHLTQIPEDLFTSCAGLQYLYLEGNELKELSNKFFPSLKQLKWLDVRNNKLTSVPSSIVDHPSLQVLLLEGNRIEALPVEIGSLTSLRGIQLARNPMSYPPQHIINQGVQFTIDFLQKQWQQLQSPQHIQLISETHSQLKTSSPKTKPFISKKQKIGGCKSAVVVNVNNREPRKPRKVQSGLSAASLNNCISVRPISQHKQQVSVTATADNWALDNDTDEILSFMNHERKRSCVGPGKKAFVSHHSKTNRKNAEDVQPKLLRDLWIEKIRQVLLAQEAIIQRRKNVEALKQWQDEAKAHQQTHPKRDYDSEINFPYDIDPEYLKMLSRKDIACNGDHRRRDLSLHHIRHEEPINSKIFSIMAALQELQMSQSASSVSPRSEQKVLAQEIKKIKEIQRSLNSLKLENFGQLGISS